MKLIKIFSLLTICLALTLFNFSFQIETKSSEKCSKFICGDVASGCAVQKEVQTYTINKNSKCADTEYCPYLSSVFDKVTPVAVTCTQKKNSAKVFPGGECSNLEDCIFGTCTDSKCIGKKEGDKCTVEKNSECEIGTFCATVSKEKGEAVCTAQEPTFGCNNDYECPNTHGCSFEMEDTEEIGKCVEYYSLDEGKAAPTNTDFSFCKSGFAADDANKNTICRSVNLKKPDTVTFVECTNDDDCVYEYTEGTVKKTTRFVGTCDCGYNSAGKAHCRPGNLDIPNYDEYIKKVKSLLSETRCHTEERNNCHFTNIHTDFKLTELENLKVDSIRKHLLAGMTDDQKCLKNAIFPNYNPDVVIPKCPKFEIKPEKTGEVVQKCAESNGYLEKDNYKVLISKCPNNGVCDYKNTLFDKTVSSVECNANTKPLSKPGEACKTNEECDAAIIDGTSKKECQNATSCVGVELTKICTSHSDCKVGAFCKTSQAGTKTCTEQIKEATTVCDTSYDCANDRLCLNSKCVVAYSVELGVNISSVETELRDVACKSGYNYNGVCAEKRYTKSEAKKVEKGLIKCQFMELCSYDISYGTATNAPKTRTISEFCTCGVNEKGDGFCPYSIHDHWVNRQTLVNNIHIKALKTNGVHTLNRRRISLKDDALCLNFYSNVAFANADSKFYNAMFASPTCTKADVDPSSTSSITSDSSETSASTSSSTHYVKTMTLFFALFLVVMFA